MRGLMVVVLVTAWLGCGGGTPSGQAQCRQSSTLSCNKIFDCAEGESLRADFGGTKAACVADLNMECTDSATGCSPGFTYHPDVAQQCLNAIRAAPCSLLASNPNEAIFPSVCDGVCTTP